MSQTYLVEFDDDCERDFDSEEIESDQPLRYSGSRENDTHYTIASLVQTPLHHEVTYEIYYGGIWTKIKSLNPLKKDINQQFIISFTGNNVPGDFEMTADWLRDIVDDNIHYKGVAVSVKPFGS